MTKPIVCTIAGSDSGGGAGIQADIKTLFDLDTHPLSVITAITAQNSQAITEVRVTPSDTVLSQLLALRDDFSPQAIKIGMLGSIANMKVVVDFLKDYPGFVVCDPVMAASSGTQFEFDHDFFIKQLLPLVDLITPNIPEAQALTQIQINSHSDMVSAAKKLLSMGVGSVLLKGGHLNESMFSQDYFQNHSHHFWLSQQRIDTINTHGSGCVLSSAIAANIANGYAVEDAIVIAKMYVSQGIRNHEKYGCGPGLVGQIGFPDQPQDLPYLSTAALQRLPIQFPSCEQLPLGLYPIVDSAEKIEALVSQGVTTLQLRIKNPNQGDLECQIRKAIQAAKAYHCRLFINDYWVLAIKHQAYGVHLGQEDLDSADISAIQQAGLRLGISTHCFYEVARAHRFRPSYIACGPIFPTTSKVMRFAPQGVERLAYWCKLLDYPVVAIGGIDKHCIDAVRAAGSSGQCFIRAVDQFLRI